MHGDDWHFSRKPAPGSGLTSCWEQILARENTLAAWDKVRRNKGAPGVDGVRISDLEACFALEWAAVEKNLRRGIWQPHPVRRVTVPKAGGGVRHLGIPTVMDRVVHQAVAQVIAPHWERRFSPHSFAYRRGLGVRAALADLVAQGAAHHTTHACHLDIERFFDSVPHEQALGVVRQAADEAAPLRLVQSVLAAGAQDGAVLIPTPLGIPQGSPLSPLLANGVLHRLDLWLAQNDLAFVRYADDIVILLPQAQHAAALLPAVAARLGRLGLQLNEGKTKLGSLAALKFLGFSFFQDQAGVWRRRISQDAWSALDSELARRSTTRFAWIGEDDGTPADYFAGWLAHFGITECPQDQARLADLARQHARPAFMPPPVARIRIPYDGGSNGTKDVKASNRKPDAGSTGSGGLNVQWLQTLRLWFARALARRWVRIGMDWGRGRRGFPLSAIRLTIGPFHFRFRL